MMGRLMLRNLAANRIRLVLSAIAVTLGVSFVAGTMIFRDTATLSFDPIFAGRAQSQTVTVRAKQSVEGAEQPLIPASVLTGLKQKTQGADGFYGQIEGYAAIVLPGGGIVGEGRTGHLGGAYVNRPGAELRLASGRAPTAAGEVVVEERTAAEGRIAVGDTITVATRRATKPMKVVGVFKPANDEIGRVFTYVGFAPDVAQDLLTGPGRYSAIFVRPAQGVEQSQLVSRLTAALPAGYEVKTGQDQVKEVKDQLSSLFEVLGRILLGFAGVAVFVGAFIIFNTFTILIAQRTRELALLRAVGASRAQVTRAVLGEAMGIGLLGSTLGLLSGVGVSYLLRLLFERFSGGTQFPLRTPVVSVSTIIWSFAIGMTVTMLAAYLPARRASKTPPVAAMRDSAVVSRRSLKLRLVAGCLLALFGGLAMAAGLAGGDGNGAVLVVAGGLILLLALAVLNPFISRPFIRVLGWPISQLAGAVGHLSRENARRDPRRSAATASALMVGLALISVATIVAGSMSASAEQKVERQFGADFSMDPRGLTGFGQDAVDRVAAVPGVRRVTPLQIGAVRAAGTDLQVMVADPAGLAGAANLEIISGTATLRQDELLVRRSLAQERGWKAGQTVEGRYPDGATATLRVAGIFADNEVLGLPAVMSPDGYRAHTADTYFQKAFIEAEGPGARESVAAALRTHPDIQLKDGADAKADARRDVDQVLNVILVLLVLSVVIAALGIMNTLGLSVIERTREIGLLRAVGMVGGQVRAMIGYESVVIAVFGALLGLGLGVTVGWALQRTMAKEGIEVLSIPVDRLGLYLLSAVVIGVVAAIWPAWRAARMNVLQAIHHP